MIRLYIYAVLLILVVLLLLKIFKLSFYCPKKIKTIVIIIVSVMLLRYISLITLFLSFKMQYLYLLKPVFFMNFIAVPIIAVTTLYIFLRKDNMSFSYSFIFTILLTLLYAAVMYKCTCCVKNLDYCGYTIVFKDNWVYWVYIALNTFMLFLAMYLLNNNNINKVGIYLIIASALMTIIEMITWIIGVSLLPENIIGDIMWIISLMYGIKKVAKINKK